MSSNNLCVYYTHMYQDGIYFDLIARISQSFIGSSEYLKIIEILKDVRYNKGTVYVMGCGGSASTATHFTADLAKTVGGFKAISLVDNIPLVSAWTNDKGWENVFYGQLKSTLTDNDVLVGFSVHGGNSKWSNNLTKAIKLAKKVGAKIIGFAGFDGGAMKKMGDACLVVPIGEEPLGTPIVEAMHVVLHHSIILDLKEQNE